MNDQAFYDTLFNLRAALIFLARESRERGDRNVGLLSRALRAEARVRVLEIERNYWRSVTRRERAGKRRQAA